MKKAITLLLALVMCLSVVSCGSSDTGSDQTGDTEEKVLTLWACAGLVSDSDQKKEQDEWAISKIAKAFEEENPGVKIEITFNSDPAAVHQMFKAAAATNDCPDLVNVWAAQQLFSFEDILLDITDMVPQEDKDNLIGWDTVSIDFTGPIMGYPISGNEVCGMFYNRQVLEDVGLDYDNNPAKTVDQFMDDMQKIKDAGYTPMIASDGGWNGAYFTTFASWWVQSSGSARVASDSLGETTFASDEGFLESYRIAAEMYEKGFINVDYTSIPSDIETFVKGQSAFLATGNWSVGAVTEGLGEENVGFCGLPDLNSDVLVSDTCIGGPGQSLVIYKNTKYPELAVDFCSFLSQKENHIEILKAQGKLPLRKDVTLEDIGTNTSGVYQQMYDMSQNYVFWADNSMDADINSEMQKLGQMVITGKMTPEELAETLDKKAG